MKTPSTLHWERHADMWRLRSDTGWTKAMLTRDHDNGGYVCVTTSAGSAPVKEFGGSSLRTLQRTVVKFLREGGWA